MSADSGARASSRKPLVETASSSMVCSESKIASRSPARPVTNCWRLTTRSDSCWSRAASVPITVVRLSITLPMTSSLSARELVSDPTWASRLSMVPPSPWNTWMISKETRFMSAGDSACSSGWNPPNSTVRSRAGVVCVSGMTAPSSRVSPPEPSPSVSAMYRWPTRLRYRMVASTAAGSGTSLPTSSSTSATGRSVPSARPMPTTWPTRTPAMRTSSPSTRPATSVNSAL